ncbi:MAG: HAMP domain-containing histidine kinase [Ruminococcaceae bacterium]|nr:HAMP domain-containing histidine kinase [Oscillospiraceae bacterium]
MKRTAVDKKTRRGIGLHTRLLVSYAVFAVVVLVLLWVSQTFLLDGLYSMVKHNELEKCADVLCENASKEPEYLAELTEELSGKYSTCVSIYNVKNNRGTRVVSEHVNSFCFLHNMTTEDMLGKLYYDARKNDGVYTERISLASMLSRGEAESDGGLGEIVVYVRLVSTDRGEHMVLLNAEMVPLDSTVSTLRLQLVYISIILFVVGIILAAVMSSVVAKPIRNMSREAAKLAMGNYNVNFDGGNCKETAQLSETLNHAAYELSKLDKMQKDLIANISHDLRTPLTMIAGYTEAMRDLPGEATPENMQIVIDETNRLTSLVNDMLEVSRYQGGAQMLNVTRFNFTEVIRRTIDRYAKLRENEGYSITFENTGDDVYVEADEKRILQVVYNLMNNAINYTGEDKSVRVRQRVVSTDDGDEVMLEVRDTGNGIPEEALPLVWERYYKVHDFHKRANMGTGLGLSIVKNILILHGARFGVTSTVGKGSCFWFRLRVSKP